MIITVATNRNDLDQVYAHLLESKVLMNVGAEIKKSSSEVRVSLDDLKVRITQNSRNPLNKKLTVDYATNEIQAFYHADLGTVSGIVGRIVGRYTTNTLE